MGFLASLLDSLTGSAGAASTAGAAATGSGLGALGTGGALAGASSVLAPTVGSSFSWMPATFSQLAPSAVGDVGSGGLSSYFGQVLPQLKGFGQGFVGYPLDAGEAPSTAYKIGQTVRSNIGTGGGGSPQRQQPNANAADAQAYLNQQLQQKLQRLQQLGVL